MIAKNNYAWLPQHRTARKSPGKKIFQIQVALLGTSPPIWRRLQVPAEIRLADLHEVLQVAMGWTDYHMHAFRCRGKWYGSTDPEQGGPELRGILRQSILAQRDHQQSANKEASDRFHL